MFEDLKFSFSLGSDNHSGVHPAVMEAIHAANRGSAHAYGMDELCELTLLEFKRVFGPDVEPQYVFTGTAANILSLSGVVRSFGAVVCSDIAHLNVDECGAPEKFLGAKLLTVPSFEGKIAPEDALPYFARMGDQHYSQPRAVSLTQATEFGTCYSLAELQAWRRFTRDRNLMLHLDGARLANAAASLGVNLRELTDAIGVDVVSFGGTKNGLMGAEAVLLFAPAKENFKFYRKQAMQLSSKTRFIAAQFYAYLRNDLYKEIAGHVTASAKKLALKLQEFPEIEVAYAVESNALFVKLPKAWVNPLRDRVFFYVWDSEINLCRWMINFDWTAATEAHVLNSIREVKKCFPVK